MNIDLYSSGCQQYVLHSRLVDVQEVVAAESPYQVAGWLPTILSDDARVYPGSPVSQSEGPTGP